jgi:hypothetical protein
VTRWPRSEAIVLLLLSLALGACAATHARETFHAVLDAGSSGTRLLVFRVLRDAKGGCHVADQKPVVDIEDKSGGLADMTSKNIEGASGADAQADDKTRFPKAAQVVKGLLASAKVAPIRERIGGIALLGTGGFRDPKRVELGAWKLMQSLDGVIFDAMRTAGGRRLLIQVRTIQGDVEGRLAWYAARELRAGHATDHAMLEVGGQTAQYARSNGGRIEAWSDDLGGNAVYRRLRGKPGFEACVNERDPSTLNADACIAYLAGGEGGFSRSRLVTQENALGPEPLWGMGGFLRATVADVQRYLHNRAKVGFGDSVELLEILTLARKACTANPPQPVPSFQPQRWCLRLSQAAALMFAIRKTRIERAADVLRFAEPKIFLVLGGESWPRGAAVSGEVFSDCK